MVFVLLELLFLFKSFVMLYKVSHLIIFTLYNYEWSGSYWCTPSTAYPKQPH